MVGLSRSALEKQSYLEWGGKVLTRRFVVSICIKNQSQSRSSQERTDPENTNLSEVIQAKSS